MNPCGPLFSLYGKVALEESAEITMLTLMNAAQVIEEIDALPAKEQEKVIVHVHQLQESQYHEEQVRIAEKRLEDLENGLEETVSHEEAMRTIIED